MTGSTLHVERVGSGPRVVFVHGSMGHGSEPFEPLRALVDGYSLEFVDRRGFGRSPARPGGVDFEADASDLVGVLGAGAHLIGHSYGGVVALIAASSRPELIRSLTLFEPAAMGLAADDPSVITLRARLDGVFPAPHGMTPGRWLATFVGALGSAVPPELPVADGESADIKASMGERPPWEARPDLDGIRTARLPVLIVRGDWAPDPEAAAIAGSAFKAIAEVIADGTGGTILVAPGATHSPQLERSDLVVPVVRQHLERAATARDCPLSTRAPDAREIAER